MCMFAQPEIAVECDYFGGRGPSYFGGREPSCDPSYFGGRGASYFGGR